jgi:hypothetical protein
MGRRALVLLALAAAAGQHQAGAVVRVPLKVRIGICVHAWIYKMKERDWVGCAWSALVAVRPPCVYAARPSGGRPAGHRRSK